MSSIFRLFLLLVILSCTKNAFAHGHDCQHDHGAHGHDHHHTALVHLPDSATSFIQGLLASYSVDHSISKMGKAGPFGPKLEKQLFIWTTAVENVEHSGDLLGITEHNSFSERFAASYNPFVAGLATGGFYHMTPGLKDAVHAIPGLGTSLSYVPDAMEIHHWFDTAALTTDLIWGNGLHDFSGWMVKKTGVVPSIISGLFLSYLGTCFATDVWSHGHYQELLFLPAILAHTHMPLNNAWQGIHNRLPSWAQKLIDWSPSKGVSTALFVAGLTLGYQLSGMHPVGHHPIERLHHWVGALSTLYGTYYWMTSEA